MFLNAVTAIEHLRFCIPLYNPFLQLLRIHITRVYVKSIPFRGGVCLVNERSSEGGESEFHG